MLREKTESMSWIVTFEFVCWLIAGLIVLTVQRRITKFEYALVWICLLVNIASRIKP